MTWQGDGLRLDLQNRLPHHGHPSPYGGATVVSQTQGGAFFGLHKRYNLRLTAEEENHVNQILVSLPAIINNYKQLPNNVALHLSVLLLTQTAEHCPQCFVPCHSIEVPLKPTKQSVFTLNLITIFALLHFGNNQGFPYYTAPL